MTDSNPTIEPQAASSFFKRNSKWTIAGIVLMSALAGAAISRGAAHWRHHHHGWGHSMHGPMNPADVDRKVERMAGHLARGVDATAEQQEKLTTIAKAAAKDLLPMRESMQSARTKARELLANPTVDKAAVEALRADQIANADAMSKRVTAAMTEAAEILTPEQRKQLAERMNKRDGHRGWGWGWRHGSDKG